MGIGNGIGSERGEGREKKAYTSDITPQPNSRERGGASDSKKPDPYY